MTNNTIEQACYRKLRKYKYQLVEDYTIAIAVKDIEVNDHPFIILTTEGKLTVKARYAWDGPSGPTFDTKTFMRGSLVHDALYQLIREKRLKHEHREYADDLIKKICLEDGMFAIRAWYVHLMLRWFGKAATKSDKDRYKKVTCVPA